MILHFLWFCPSFIIGLLLVKVCNEINCVPYILNLQRLDLMDGLLVSQRMQFHDGAGKFMHESCSISTNETRIVR